MWNKKDEEQQKQRKTDITSILKSYSFKPPFWLSNTHLQTVWGAFRSYSLGFPEHSYIQTPDGEYISFYYRSSFIENAPLLLIVHGLEGSAQSSYVGSLNYKAAQIGWASACFEHRSCGKSSCNGPRTYHLGFIDDLDFIINHLCKKFPHTRIYLTGFSLGGNLVSKWIGEKGRSSNTPKNVIAVASISSPATSKDLPFFVDEICCYIYPSCFLKTLIPKAIIKIKNIEGWPESSPIRDDLNNKSQPLIHSKSDDDDENEKKIKKIQRFKKIWTVRDYDELILAPAHGFKSSRDYYDTTVCGQYLSSIKRPWLFITSQDDPFFQDNKCTYEFIEKLNLSSKYIHSIFTKNGGHCAFYSDRYTYWAEEQIMRFFQFYENSKTL